MHSSLSIHFTLLTSGGEDEGDGEGLCSQDPQQVGDAQETSGQCQSHSQTTFSTGLIPRPVSFPDSQCCSHSDIETSAQCECVLFTSFQMKETALNGILLHSCNI